METISIGLGEPTAELRSALDAALRPLRARGARVELRESRRGALHFLTCALDADPARSEAARSAGVELRRTVAGLLAGCILERREPALIARLLGAHYSYLTAPEREAVLAIAGRRLGRDDLGAPGPADRRVRIGQRLDAYLERQGTVVLDGFVTFRLKDYVDTLVAAVDRAVDEFLLEREYREFIDLLRHVVESRPDRPAAVDCLPRGDGRFDLRDEGGRAVGRAFLEESAPEAAAHEVGAEELLVSALITVAPREVRLHVPEESAVALSPEVLGTLEAVFRHCVRICRGCPRCLRRAEG